MEEFVTKKGLTLHLKPVSTGAIQSMLGGSRTMLSLFVSSDEDVNAAYDEFDSLSGEEQAALVADFEPLFNYCLGWGVTDDPPPEAADELKMLGLNISNRREARIKWLRILELDQEDMGTAMGRVLALSMAKTNAGTGEEPDFQPDGPASEQADEAAALRARLAELEAAEG
jgi:hypothetical protein